MKLQKEPIDVDLYIVNKPLTEAERKEVTEFIRKDKKRRKLAAKRAHSHKKAKETAYESYKTDNNGL